MELIGPTPLNGITIKSLRDFILDNGITERDTIVLNSKNFDDIVLEYRAVYKESITVPYLLLGVLIDEDGSNVVSKNTVIVIKNDDREDRVIAVQPYEEYFDNSEVFYRCGWCGNVVNYDGSQLSDYERSRKIELYEKHATEMRTEHVNGHCCPNGHSKSK